MGVTDHGNIFGAVAFYTACKEKGIKPILGVEAYVTPPGKPPGSHVQRRGRGWVPPWCSGRKRHRLAESLGPVQRGVLDGGVLLQAAD